MSLLQVLQARSVGVAVFFIFILLSGIWLSRRRGRYGALLLNVHKFLGLAIGALLGLTVYQVARATALGVREIAAVALTVLLFAGTVAAGGLLSTAKPMPAAILRLHQVVPYVAVLSTAAMLYLPFRG